MNKTKQKIQRKDGGKMVAVLLIIAIVLLLWMVFCGWQWGWGPFHSVQNYRFKSLPGNASEFNIENVNALTASPLKDMNICYLGSSVTYGASSCETSFVEYISIRNGCTAVKEAVSGTTLVDNGPSSYISRLKKLDKGIDPDLFICQLSTNDASQKKPLGEISHSFQSAELDTSTITGAVEYIVAYVTETWGCPVVFYTGSKYNSEQYAAMVEMLFSVQEKWGIGVIDLWNDTAFNDISAEQYALYMNDPIHPTKAGYLEWWTPAMEAYLYEFVGQQNQQ